MIDLQDELAGGDLPSPDQTPFRIDTAESLLLLPDPEWLIDGIIQENSLALIYGPSGCGKSFLALDLAHHLALKRTWFGYNGTYQIFFEIFALVSMQLFIWPG